MATRPTTTAAPPPVLNGNAGADGKAQQEINLAPINPPKGATNAKIKASIEYDAPVTENKPPQRPTMPPEQLRQMQMQQQNNNRNAIEITDSIQDLLEFWEDEISNGVAYIRVTRLIDANGMRFNKPCSVAQTYPTMPLTNNLISDIQNLDNSGGTFRGLIVDENGQRFSDAMDLKPTTIANPAMIASSATATNENDKFELLLRQMQESNKTLLETISRKPEESEMDKLIKTVMMKKITDNLLDDKPTASNPYAGLPPETAMMIPFLSNPIAAKAGMSKLTEAFTKMFDNGNGDVEKTNVPQSGLASLFHTWNTDAEFRKEAMSLGNKVLGVIGVTLQGVLGKEKKPPMPRKNPASTANTDAATEKVVNEETANVNNESNFVDAEYWTEERIAEMEALKTHPLTIEALAFFDSDVTLTLDNEFTNKIKETHKKQYLMLTAIAAAKEFSEVYEMITNEYPFIEDFVMDVPRRLERLKEFHTLLVNE